MKRNAIVAAALLCLPALRARAACRDVDILDEAVRARSIQHELDDAASDWQEDLTRASLVGDEHDAPLLAGASMTFVQENLFAVHDDCARAPVLGARPRIEGSTAVMSALVSDPAHRLELRPFFAWTSVGLQGAVPDGSGFRAQQLAGVAASTPWVEASWARTPDGRQLLRLGSPLVGDVDLLDVDHLRRHWLQVTTNDFDVGRGFGVGAGVEHRPWQSLNLVTARGDWTWHDPDSPQGVFQPYAEATWRVAPAGLEGARAGARIVGDGAFNQGRDWGDVELFAELSAFDGVPGTGPLAGGALGFTARAGGRHGCFGIVMSTGVNQADTLLDVPSARNRQDNRIGIYFRIEPTVMRPRS
jgi:hypothetical protein